MRRWAGGRGRPRISRNRPPRHDRLRPRRPEQPRHLHPMRVLPPASDHPERPERYRKRGQRLPAHPACQPHRFGCPLRHQPLLCLHLSRLRPPQLERLALAQAQRWPVSVRDRSPQRQALPPRSLAHSLSRTAFRLHRAQAVVARPVPQASFRRPSSEIERHWHKLPMPPHLRRPCRPEPARTCPLPKRIYSFFPKCP